MIYQCFLVIHLEINNSLQATLSSIICLFTYGQSCQLLHGNNKSITSMHLMHTGSSGCEIPQCVLYNTNSKYEANSLIKIQNTFYEFNVNHSKCHLQFNKVKRHLRTLLFGACPLAIFDTVNHSVIKL